MNIQASNLINVIEFASAERSRTKDAEYAAEAAKIGKAHLLPLVVAAILAQANAAPRFALQLVKRLS